MTREEQIYYQAKKLNACPMMSGVKDIDELIELFFTPQGIEFCAENNFPSIGLLMDFKGGRTERSGIYINTPVNGKNLGRVALFGEQTVAELEYDDPAKLHTVIIMHGAKAKIKATGYAVVSVVNGGGDLELDVSGNAVIL